MRAAWLSLALALWGCTHPPPPAVAATAPTAAATSPAPAPAAAAPSGRLHDVVIRGGTIYDGSGGAPFVGDLAIDDDTITAVGGFQFGRAVIEAKGLAVAPGFINMLSHAAESLSMDGRGESDLRQGITLEVFGETSVYPFGATMEALADHGISVNIAGLFATSRARMQAMSLQERHPTPAQLAKMQKVVAQAMDEGALGLTSALIYTPDHDFNTDELVALAKVAGEKGGIYAAHIRNESNGLLPALDEMIEIARRARVSVEIYHFKQAGKANWGKQDAAVAKIEAARRAGLDVSADMYLYEAAATGLDAAMPPWVRQGGNKAWLQRLRDPATRARCAHDMETAAGDWDDFFAGAGPDGMLLTGFGAKALKPLIGKTLAEVARQRHTSPADTAMDLVLENGGRGNVIYFLMSEANVRRQVALPWMSFGSDSDTRAVDTAGGSVHPRAYGNFARLLGRYVRELSATTLASAIHRLTAMPAEKLHLDRRGRLQSGYFADVVVFDPQRITDHATYQKPHAYATGMVDVLVNGIPVLAEGEYTERAPGRFIRRRSP